MRNEHEAQEPAISDEDRYRLLVRSVKDYAIYMLDPAGRVTSWNPGAERFKGYAEDEILGEHFSRFYTDEDRQSGLPQRALETAAREGRFEQEGWRVRKDGTRIWAHVVIDPILSPTEKLVGFAKITRDISEQQASREALRRSEERFRLLVQGVKDYAIYMLDPGGGIANWNTGAQHLKGYTEEEVAGRHFSLFYTDEDRESGLPARALKTAEREGRFEQEGWRVRKDGNRFWAHVVIESIWDRDGALIGFAKVTRDITEKRAAQLALEEARSRILQSQKMEAIGQLTGGVAHDFNNLLAVILGNLDLARKRLPDDPNLKRLIDNSVQATKRGAALTERMLAFARRQELKTEPVDVPELVRNMADLLQSSIGPLVSIGTQFPLPLSRVLADPHQLELAVLNFAVNARDAMPDGGSILIAAREHNVQAGDPDGLAPGEYVCLSVTDSGQGMDETTLARAAEPFFTTKGVGKGTGLGLSMAHGFAEQSGGRLLLKSRTGQGTTAELWLPVAKGAADVHDVRPADPGPPRSPGALSILVVDDDSLVLMSTAAMLEDLDHEVVLAMSGEQALRVLRQGKRIDLVITDQLMPGITGAQLIEAIRSEWPKTPTILATGYSEIPVGAVIDVQRLAKPFSQDDLARAVSAAAARPSEQSRVVTFRRA